MLFLPPTTAASLDKDPLTPRQREWLNAHKGQLTLAFEPNWPPTSFFSPEGKAQGIFPEYISLLEEKLGFHFNYQRYDSWAEILQAGYEGALDVIPTIARLPEREPHLYFTRPYFQIPTVIITGADGIDTLNLEDMEGKQVCVLREGASQEVLAKHHPDIEMVPVTSVLQGLKMVSRGDADGLVADLASTSYLIEKHGLHQLQNSGYTPYNYEIGMGVSREHPMLVEILNRALPLITPDEKRAVMKKWLYPEPKPFYREAVFRAYFISLLVVAGGGVLLGTLLWNRSLQRAVERATRMSRMAEESLRAQAVELEGARQRVARANLELNQVFDASTPMLIIDREFRLLRMNRTFSDLFGVDPASIAHKRCYEVIRGDMCRSEACPLNQALAGKVSRRGEGIFSSASREGIPCLVGANTLTDENGQLVGIVDSFTNISRLLQAEEEKERLREQLLQSQKMEALGTLAGGIAHDFNNILSPIIGYAEMTQLSLPEESVEAQSMAGILKAAQRARNLVRQILTLSRRHQAELKPVHVQAVMKEALTLLRSTLPSTIAIKQELHAEGRMIHGDPTQVHQIIMNLCTNAYHAMEGLGGGTLEVSLDPVSVDEEMASARGLAPGPCLRIRVRDTGVGMDASSVDRIYDPYFTTKGEGKGTGLGLSVVHGIVRETGGSIRVASEQGRGTTFTLCFPEVEGGGHVQETVGSVERPRGREAVLVVDDEEEVVLMLTRMLCRAGYRVTAATGSSEALSVYRASPAGFDLVVTDMTMPEMTGYDLAKAIKAITPDVPVILCTGYNDGVVCERAEQIGVTTFLAKPVEMNTLLTAVRRELDGCESNHASGGKAEACV